MQVVSGRVQRPLVDANAEKRAILNRLGSNIAELNDIVFLDRVLVAKYISDKAGSLLRTDKTKQNDNWQSKVGLVLAIGPAAFKEDQHSGSFYGASIQVGDWVWFNDSEGYNADYCPTGSFERVPLRLLQDKLILGRVPRPDIFY